LQPEAWKKDRNDYQRLLAESLAQMHQTLKSGACLSMVYAHRDASYWQGLVVACRDAGFRYVNTVSQPVGAIWSMHKKKNPLTFLSGELVLNYQKTLKQFFDFDRESERWQLRDEARPMARASKKDGALLPGPFPVRLNQYKMN
jgi:adenine-specific DNA methylase